MVLNSLLARARQRKALRVVVHQARIRRGAAPQQPIPRVAVLRHIHLVAALQLLILQGVDRLLIHLAVLRAPIHLLAAALRVLIHPVGLQQPIHQAAVQPPILPVVVLVQVLIRLAVGPPQPMLQAEHRHRGQEAWGAHPTPRLGQVVTLAGRVSEATSNHSATRPATAKSKAVEGCRNQGTAGNRQCKVLVGSLDHKASTGVD